MSVAYLGPAGTFSHAALLASGRPEAAGDQVAVGSEREAVLAVASGTVDAALVPVENSIEGGVNATLDTLVRDAPDVVVLGEELLPVSHALIVRPGVGPDSVERVLSHPQPLAQCRRSLERLLPGVAQVRVASTAEAVRLVSESGEPIAAVGPAAAAPIYGCEVLERGLEDEPGNTTRFWWLRRAGDRGPATEDGRPMRTSIVFAGDGDSEPGWLLGALGVFAERDLNLTRIESRPSRERLGHYLFLVDVDGAAGAGGPMDGAIDALRRGCSSVRVLGSYPVRR